MNPIHLIFHKGTESRDYHDYYKPSVGEFISFPWAQISGYVTKVVWTRTNEVEITLTDNVPAPA